MTCPNCGYQLVYMTSMGPDAARLAEWRRGCDGRAWWFNRDTGDLVRVDDETPAAAARE
jgi:hypothetical protein